jgi:4-hydroxy-2-oxoheptanedioate aldolase
VFAEEGNMAIRTAGMVIALAAAALVHAEAPQAPAPPPPSPPGRINPVIARLEAGGIADGEVWQFIDMEPNPYDIVGLRKMIDDIAVKRKADGSLEKAPIVRVPMYGDEPSAWAALQVLDLGALGVVFQSIESKAGAERVIASMRFPVQKGSTIGPYPRGRRSGAPRGGKTLVMGADELLKRADVWPLNPQGELLAIIMIESLDGLKNIDQILSVPGIGSTLVGMYDMSLSLGVGPPKPGPYPYAPAAEAAIQTIAKSCQVHKVVCGIAAGGGPEYRQKLIKQGYRLFLN